MSHDTPPNAVSEAKTNPVQLFLQNVFVSDPRVTTPAYRSARFGSNGFKIGGKVFAMEWQGALAVKLPAQRVCDLAVKGTGTPLQMGNRRMKEWLVTEDRATWPALAMEARDHMILLHGSC